MYHTYVLYSKKYDRIYIGQTNNIEIRFEKHNAGKIRSTKPYIPWIKIYSEFFKTRSEAMKRENELKSHQGRNYIREKILSE